jgi:glucose-6-phosphate-specific signal transduction histidine kinase
LGVAGMRERASIVGGTLEVQSQALKGTRVYFRVSINGEISYLRSSHDKGFTGR